MSTTATLAGRIEEEAGGKARHRAVTRVQMDLPPRSMERLTALKDKTEAASYAEVIKNALRLYEALINEADQGNEFLVRDKEGNTVPYRLFL